MDVRVGLWRKLTVKNWCFWTVVLEKTLESPLDCKEIQPVHSKGYQSWVFIGRTDAIAETPTLATWFEELTHWKRPWCWVGLGAGGEGNDRGWAGWMASPTRWTWVWVNSGSWWWTGRPGMLRFMGSQRVWHDWATELNWTIVSVPQSLWLFLCLWGYFLVYSFEIQLGSSVSICIQFLCNFLLILLLFFLICRPLAHFLTGETL